MALEIVAGTLLALAVVAALALVLQRRPAAFPLLAIFALPFRLPISADGRTVNLLIPLYLVVAAGTLVHLLPKWLGRGEGWAWPPAGSGWRAAGAGEDRPGDAGGPVRGDGRLGRTRGRRGWHWLSARNLEWLLLGAVVLYALQATYSIDHAKAAENIAFFYLPFGLLFMLLRDVRWSTELLLACLGVAVGLAILFAGVGFIEYARKELFLNPKVVAANEYDNYFRVNSAFFDPSIYGRFLALVMIAITTIVLWSPRRRDVLIAAAVLAWLLAGLITSFSQSSLVALLLGLAVLAAYRWDALTTVCASVGIVALAGVVLVAAPANFHFGLKGSGGSASNATSGRASLVEGGLELFADRPLYGYGSGSFEAEYKRHDNTTAENAVSASHTIPITVAAEQGILGLGLYVALLVCAFAVLFGPAGETSLGRSPPRLGIAACFAALVLHTWTYADFLEDPTTWTLLGIGVALARTRPGSSRPREPLAADNPVGVAP
ncbi:MAG TPA: O-antigen ligase family protein [Solirubrobacteraceae bacterium]|nr:O-antigen ligase family protein [Solirubrobacteraceae bacterium]